MMRGIWKKWPVLALLVLAGVAVVMAPEPDRQPAPSEPARAHRAPPTMRADTGARHEAGRVELERLRVASARKGQDAEIANAFNAMSWYVPPPPPPPPPPAPPPKPTAPPVPFTYLGSYEDAPSRVLILARGDKVYTVAEGEVIDNTYRIGRVEGGRLELDYIPLGVKQYVSMVGAT